MSDGNGLTPPNAPPGAPPPGISICGGCPDIANCERQVASGVIPSCAGPSANTSGAGRGPSQTGTNTPYQPSATGNTPIGTPGGAFNWTLLGQQVALIVVSLVIVVMGFYLLFSKQVGDIAKKVVP